MAWLRKKKTKVQYWVAYPRCLGKSCFVKGSYEHRGAIGAGTRNTGAISLCCLTNAYHGCPMDHEKKFNEEVLKVRKENGWVAKY